MKTVPVRDGPHWRELRAAHLGASEVAALFDLHPQLTKFELWNIKAGKIAAEDISESERVFWGTVLEPAVATGIAKLKGWNIRKVRRYIIHSSVTGMGASLDYEIAAHDKGRGALEIKTVDRLQFMGWPDGEPPMGYELQLQHQLAVTGWAWGALGVLVGGNDLRIFARDRHEGTIRKLETAVAEFWKSIEEKAAPKPDFLKDADAIARLYAAVTDGKAIDMTHDNRAMELCRVYREAADEEKSAKEKKESAKAELLTKIKDATKAVCGDYMISAKEVAGAMISYERKPYRSFRINERQAKERGEAA